MGDDDATKDEATTPPGGAAPPAPPRPPSPPADPNAIDVEIPTDDDGAGEGFVGLHARNVEAVRFDNVAAGDFEWGDHPEADGITRIVVKASPVKGGTVVAHVTTRP